MAKQKFIPVSPRAPSSGRNGPVYFSSETVTSKGALNGNLSRVIIAVAKEPSTGNP